MQKARPTVNQIIPYSSIYIDMPVPLLLKSLMRFCQPINRDQAEENIEKIFIKSKANEKLLITLCVRSSLDLIYQALDFPPGSEILMTCINIPQMSQITRYHGLVPIPLEVDLPSLQPSLEDIKAQITPLTKAIMISYIYGVVFDATEIISLAKAHNLIIIEDIAEGFIDGDYNGHPQADFSLFSFGTIKHLSAFGGSLTVCRHNFVLYQKMKRILNEYPYESNLFFMKRIAKNIILMLVLNNRVFNKAGRLVSNSLDIDYKELSVGLARGFNVSPENFLLTFRKQIPSPMLAMMDVRFKNINNSQILKDRNKVMFGQKRLMEGGVEVPGFSVDTRHFWLFPILTPDAGLANKYLNAKGVDAYLGATQLKIIEPPIGYKYKSPVKTKAFFEKILYLPIHKGVPEKFIEKICFETVQVIALLRELEAKNIELSSKL